MDKRFIGFNLWQKALFKLLEKGSYTNKTALARDLKATNCHLFKVINRMQEIGLVKINTNRKQQIKLTMEGLAVAEAYKRVYDALKRLKSK